MARHLAQAKIAVGSNAAPLPAGGFTMIELIVVMMVIGILAIAVLPRFDLLRGFDEIGYRDQVRATLQYARKAAVAQRRYVCVERSGSSLLVTIDNDIPENMAAGTCPRPRNLNLPGSNSNQIDPRGSVTLLGTSTAAFTFSALGSPSAAASFTVHGDSDYIVSVEAETGYVH